MFYFKIFFMVWKIYFNCKKSTHDSFLCVTTNQGSGVKCNKNKYNIFILTHLSITEGLCTRNAY